MSQIRENIVEMIDKGLAANRQEGFCSCGYKDEVEVRCNNCIIRDALMVSRSCVILSISRIDVLKAKVEAGQKEVEKKLKELIKKEGVRERR